MKYEEGAWGMGSGRKINRKKLTILYLSKQQKQNLKVNDISIH